MIKITHKGDLTKTKTFLTKASQRKYLDILSKYGEKGVSALSAATPVDSGLTAKSWSYSIELTSSGASITWSNSNVVKGVNIAVILQYGHGTGTGGYVAGRDYINPAMRDIFDQIATDAWEEVTSS